MNVFLSILSVVVGLSGTALAVARLLRRRHGITMTDVQLLEPVREKYGHNRLPEFVRESIVTRLTECMNCEQPWLRYDLTLAELADAINVNSHHLSQIINSEFGKSFACYINGYRVQAACQLLASGKNKTVLDVAMESGFASKSSFNAVFKKFINKTPSEFRRQNSERIEQTKQSEQTEVTSLKLVS